MSGVIFTFLQFYLDNNHSHNTQKQQITGQLLEPLQPRRGSPQAEQPHLAAVLQGQLVEAVLLRELPLQQHHVPQPGPAAAPRLLLAPGPQFHHVELLLRGLLRVGAAIGENEHLRAREGVDRGRSLEGSCPALIQPHLSQQQHLEQNPDTFSFLKSSV